MAGKTSGEAVQARREYRSRAKANVVLSLQLRHVGDDELTGLCSGFMKLV